MRKIKYIVVHTSESYPYMDIGVKEIDRWHKEKGYVGVGYHYVVRKNGEIEEGRKEYQVGAHCFGYNHNSIGVCWVGGLKNGTKKEYVDDRTDAQKEALIGLLMKLVIKYPDAKIVGHRDLDPKKECPLFDAMEEYKLI